MFIPKFFEHRSKDGVMTLSPTSSVLHYYVCYLLEKKTYTRIYVLEISAIYNAVSLYKVQFVMISTIAIFNALASEANENA